jgi:RNA polymerase sigma-70 factor (ECF subfamily)
MDDVASAAEDFRELIRRVRAGDEQAAVALVRRYEPAIRRAARVRLSDTRLNRLLDSMDVCQSVMASFFVRAALGQYELETPEQLLRLLATMTRNKLANQAKAHRASRRDLRRIEDHSPMHGGDLSIVDRMEDLPGPGRTPSSEVALRELLQEAQRRLSDEELSLLEQRVQGRQWTEIAAELGSSPEAIRKRLARGVARVASELGLDDRTHEQDRMQ